MKMNLEDHAKNVLTVVHFPKTDTEEGQDLIEDLQERKVEEDHHPALNLEREEREEEEDIPTPEREDLRIEKDLDLEIRDPRIERDPILEIEELEDLEIEDPRIERDLLLEIEELEDPTQEIKEIEDPETENLKTKKDLNPKIKRMIKKGERIHHLTQMIQEIRRKMINLIKVGNQKWMKKERRVRINNLRILLTQVYLTND